MTGLIVDVAEYFQEYRQRSIVILNRTADPEFLIHRMYICAMKASQSQQHVEQIFVLKGQLRNPMFVHVPVFGVLADSSDGGRCVEVQ